MSGQSADSTSDLERSVLKQISDVAQRVLALVVFVSAIGWQLFYGILGKFTSVSSWNVYPQVFIVYGVTFLLFFGAKALLPFVITYGIIFAWFGRDLRRTNQFVRQVLLHPVFWVASAIVIWYYLSFPQYILPTAYFNLNSPRVALVFKEPIDPDLWKLSTEPNQPRRTRPLIKITDYTDSILVKDPTTGAVVEVKNDLLAAIIDITSLAQTPTTNPIATP